MEMRRAIAALVVMIGGIVFPGTSLCMHNIVSDVYGPFMNIDRDTYLAAGVVVSADSVNIENSVRVKNAAEIQSDIFVCDNCDFHIQNSGTVSGMIHLGSGAEMVQVIKTPDDVTFLRADAPYVVLADGAHSVSWNDLYMLGVNAGTLVLRDSDILLDNPGLRLASVGDGPSRVVLRGVITLNLPDGYDGFDSPVIRNVAGDANVVISGMSPGTLYAYKADIRNGDLYVNLVRETDYYKILGTHDGIMLNKIRDIMPGDELLRRLDAASNMAELRHIMSHSVALNPIRLTRPMRVLDKFMINAVFVPRCKDCAMVGLGARPFYIYSDNFSAYGVSSEFIFSPGGHVDICLSGYGAVGRFDDGLNVFDAVMYGGNFNINYSGDFIRARAVAGATFADFNVPYIFDNDRIKDAARAMTIYGLADVGLIIGCFRPYVGAQYHGARIFSDADTDFNARTGIEAEFVSAGIDLEYRYKIDVGINSANDTHAGIGLGIWSPYDMMGGDISINSVQDSAGMSYMFSVSAKIRF